MKLVYTILFVQWCFFSGNAAGYHYNIDLSAIRNDQLPVVLTTDLKLPDEVNFMLPAIIPGTYEVYNYGRYVSDFSVLDQQGNLLPFSRLNENTWRISNAGRISKIEYRINDTFDQLKDSIQVFQPAGTNFQSDSDYLLNFAGICGYFENHDRDSLTIRIAHARELHGTTALRDLDLSPSADMFGVPSYHQLVDNPVMYAHPDTAVIYVANCRIEIGVFSPYKELNAHFLALQLDTLMHAAASYLGGKLPVDNYAFIVYYDRQTEQGGGALEHSYSSVYYLPAPEKTPDQKILKYIGQEFRDVAAHEFFHILTPLGIHSEEIHYFDFNRPRMSQQLWLYEGTTEYNAFASQLKGGLISFKQFLNIMSGKMQQAQSVYNDSLPFTEMSAGCLDKYKDQYPNVYEKGALLGWCLDLELLIHTQGRYGLVDLVNDLVARFGKDRPFKDEDLFDVIKSLTYPEIELFFKNYVEGTSPLPYDRFLKSIGVDYESKYIEKRYSLGGIILSPRRRGAEVYSIARINQFGEKIGYRKGDILWKINNIRLTAKNFNHVISRWNIAVKEGDNLKLVIYRADAAGKHQKIKRCVRVEKTAVITSNFMQIKEADAEQKIIREAFLHNK